MSGLITKENSSKRTGSSKAEPLDEKDLVQKACLGDLASFEKLYWRYYMQVYKLAFKLCSNQQDAEDVAQNTFIKAARGIRNFQGKSMFRTWLFRITVNCSHDFRSQRKKHSDIASEIGKEVDNGQGVVAATSSQQEHNEYQQVVAQALDKLSDKQREVMILVYMEEHTHDEAAKILNCSINTVSWRVFAAKNKLKSILKKNVKL